MAIKSRRVTVTDEPTLLASRVTDVGERQSAEVLNLDDEIVIDVGDVDVASGEGRPLKPDHDFSVDLEGREALYAVAPDGQSVEVSVFEQGI